MKNCPPANAYEQMLENRLSEDAERKLAEHLETCHACQQLLESLTTIGGGVAITAHRLPAGEASRDERSREAIDKQSAPVTSERSLEGLAALLPLIEQPARDGQLPLGHDTCEPVDFELEIPGYTIVRELGRGGMGVVFQALDVQLNRLVAIKYLRTFDAPSAERQVRFHMEGETIARLSHPNIVQLFQVGSHRGRPYYVMEFVDGGTLADHVDKAPQDAHCVAELAETIARAIAYAHSQRVVHRDLKPSNILLTRDPLSTRSFYRPRIADFGLARNLDASHLSLTDTGLLAGTPNYMAPEQIQGSALKISPRTDIYAIGAIIYQMLTGRPPFLAASVLDTMTQLANDDPINPKKLEPSVPRELEIICLKCLRKEPQKRYTSAEALADDLQRFRLGQPIRAKSTTVFERLWRMARRNPVTAGLSLIVVLLIMLATAGSVIYTKTLMQQLTRAERAEEATSIAHRKANETLFDSYLEQARIFRLSGRVGQRSKSLEALKQAGRLAQGLGLDDATQRRLRNEVIASLALVDFRLLQSWNLPRPAGEGLGIDANSPRYAVCNQHNQIEIRSTVDNRILSSIPCSQPVQVLRFSPSDQYLAGVSWADARSKCFLWDVASKQLVFQTPHEAAELALAFNTRNDALAIGLWSGEIRIYDIPSGTYRTLLRVRRNPNHILFSPSDDRIAIANQVAPLVEIGEIKSGQIVTELRHPAAVRHLSWSKDGRLLATGCDDDHIYVWDVNTGELKSKLDGHRKHRIYLAFNRNANRLLSQSPDGTSRIWDPLSGRQLVRLDTRSVFQWSENDAYIVGASADRFERWEALDHGEFSTVYHGDMGNESRRPTTFGLTNIDYHPTRALMLSAGFDGVRFWNPNTKTQVAYLPLDAGCTARFDPNGRLIVLSNGTLRHANAADTLNDSIENSSSVALPIVPLFGNSRMTFDETGDTFALANRCDNVVIVGQLNGNERRMMDVLRPSDVALSPDGRRLAVATRFRLILTDLATEENVLDVDGRFDCVAFHPNGRSVVAGNHRHYKLWDLAKLDAPPKILGRPADNVHVGATSFSRCGRFLAVAFDRQSIKLLDADMREELATLHSPETVLISQLRFNAQSTQLAVGNENHTLQFWDLEAIDRQLVRLKLAWNRRLAIVNSVTDTRAHKHINLENERPHTFRLQVPTNDSARQVNEGHTRSPRFRTLLGDADAKAIEQRWATVNQDCRRAPSPANRLARGWLNAKLGDFDAAAADWAATIRPDSEENWDLFRRSILRLYLGDEVGHARDCHRILDMCSDTTHPTVYERALRSFTLAKRLPLKLVNQGENAPDTMMRSVASTTSPADRQLFSLGVAAACLRNGNHRRSIELLQSIISQVDTQGGYTAIHAHLLLSLNLLSTASPDQAMQHLNRAVEHLEDQFNRHLNESSENWHQLLVNLILMREIESAIPRATSN